MATIIYFLAGEHGTDAGGSGGLYGTTVVESPEQVQNQWEAADGQHGLLHLTQRHRDHPIHVRRDAIAYWAERL